jgi:hypothetical protein
VCDETGSFMVNKVTGDITYFREDAGNYMLDVWVRLTRHRRLFAGSDE